MSREELDIRAKDTSFANRRITCDNVVESSRGLIISMRRVAAFARRCGSQVKGRGFSPHNGIRIIMYAYVRTEMTPPTA